MALTSLLRKIPFFGKAQDENMDAVSGRAPSPVRPRQSLDIMPRLQSGVASLDDASRTAVAPIMRTAKRWAKGGSMQAGRDIASAAGTAVAGVGNAASAVGDAANAAGETFMYGTEGRPAVTAARPTVTMPGNYLADPKPELAAKVGSLMRRQQPTVAATPGAVEPVAATPAADVTVPASPVVLEPVAASPQTGVFVGGQRAMSQAEADVMTEAGIEQSPNQNLEALRASGGRGILRANGELMAEPPPDGEVRQSTFNPSRVAGVLANAEQALMRKNAAAGVGGEPAAPVAAAGVGGEPAAPVAAPGTVPVGPAIMRAREKQQGTMADMAYGFASPMTRKRIAGREGDVRQQGVMRTRQENAVALANINAKAAVDAAAAGAKPVGPTVNMASTKRFDPKTGKVVEESDTPIVINNQGAQVDAAGQPMTPADIKKQNIADAVASVDQVMQDTKGGLFNIGMKGSDAKAQKKIDDAIMNAATVALGTQATAEDVAAIKAGMAKGKSLEFMLSLAQNAKP